MRLRWPLLPSLFAAACAAPVNDVAEPEPDPPVVALPVPDDVAMCIAPEAEPVAEACDALGLDTLCTGACLALHAAGCLAVILAATDVAVVSVGSLTLPAGFVIAAACTLSDAACTVGCVGLLS